MLGKAIQNEKWVPKSQSKHQGQPLLSLLWVPQIDQAAQLSHIFRGPRSVLCTPWLMVQTVQVPMSQASLSCGFSWNVHHYHHPYPSPSQLQQSLLSSQTYFPRSAQSWAMGLWVCLHQSLDKDSPVITRLITNLITEDGQFRLCIHCCWKSLEINTEVSQEIGNRYTSNPTIPLLGIYPNDAQLYHKDICSTIS